MTWNFRQGGKTENPKDSGIKDFSKNIFESGKNENDNVKVCVRIRPLNEREKSLNQGKLK